VENNFDDRLMPAREVRARCGGISRDTLDDWLRAGLLPEPVIGRHDGRRRYWRASDIEAFVTLGRATPSEATSE